MSSSYLYSGVLSNCTMMTNGKPLQLVESRQRLDVGIESRKVPILNKDDKKLSDTFKCKQANKFWGGLEMFAAIIAVAALVALTVATGGLALIIAAIAVTASVGTTMYAAFKGITHIAHDCDFTLQSEWQLYHGTVTIDGANAILQHSCLKCKKGGIVQPFISSELAYEAARQITDNNLKEFHEGEEAQALIGLVSVLSVFDPRGWKNIKKGPSAIGLLIVGVFGVMEYNETDGDEKDGIQYNQSKYSDTYYNGKGGEIEGDTLNKTEVVRDSAAGGAGGVAAGKVEVIDHNSELEEAAKEWDKTAAERYGSGGSIESVESATLASAIFRRSFTKIDWKDLGKGLGVGAVVGVTASVVNYRIGKSFHDKENKLFEETQKYTRIEATHDKKNNIGIIAQSI